MAEKVRFYTETHIAGAAVAALRRRGADVLTAQNAGMHDAADREHLEFAFSQGRVLVSRDGDFPGLHRLGHAHAGIIFFPSQRNTRQMIEWLLYVFETCAAEEMRGQLYFL